MKQPDKQRTPEELKAIETALCQVRDSIEKYLLKSVADAWAYAKAPPKDEGGAPSTIHRYFFDKSGKARVVARQPEIWPPLPLPLPREPVAGGDKTEMRAFVGQWAVREVCKCAPLLLSDDARTYECRRDTIGPLLASYFPYVRHFKTEHAKDTVHRWALDFLCMDGDMDNILQGALLCANPWQLKETEDPPDADAGSAESRQQCLWRLAEQLLSPYGYAEILAELAFVDRLLANALQDHDVGEREVEALMVTLLRDKANVWKALRHLACLKSVSAKTLRCRGGDLLGTLEKLKQHYDGAADKNETKATGQEEAEAAGKEEATVTGQEENAATDKQKKKRGPYSGPAFDKLCVSVEGGVEPLHEAGRFPSVEGPIEQGIRFNVRKDAIKEWLTKNRCWEVAALALAAIDGRNRKGTYRGKPVFGTPFPFFPDAIHVCAKEAQAEATKTTKTPDRAEQVEAVLRILENVGNLPTLPSTVDTLRAKLLEYPEEGWEELKVALLLPGLARHYARELAGRRGRTEREWLLTFKPKENRDKLRQKILDGFPDRLLEETRPKADTPLATDKENLNALREDLRIQGSLSTEGTSYDDFIQNVMVEWHIDRCARTRNKENQTERNKRKKDRNERKKERNERKKEMWNLREALWTDTKNRSMEQSERIRRFQEDWDAFKCDLRAYCRFGKSSRETLDEDLLHFYLRFSEYYPKHYASVVSLEEHLRAERELEELKEGKEANHGH